jgi:predicted transcriptional regulator
MAEQKTNEGSGSRTFAMETQKERWVKYGANVALVSVLVLVLSGVGVYIFERHRIRTDTTASGAYSLKPPTVQLIKNSPQKVRLVGLFSRKDSAQQQQKKVQDVEDSAEVRYQRVADLLSEYQQKSGGKIQAEMIDPDAQPGKVAELFVQVQKRYGNDVARYEEVLKEYPKTLDEITKLTSQEKEAVQKLPEIKDKKVAQTVGEIFVTVEIFPQLLDQIKVGVKKQLELKVPDYKGAADSIRSGLEGLNERIDAVLGRFKQAKEDKNTPKEFMDYVAQAQARYETMKKAADDLLGKLVMLGELKQVDELRRNQKNSIAIMGETDMKVIPQEEIFKVEDVRMMDAERNLRPRFAGEQQVSTALVTLTSKEKKKVAFIRSGGPPVTARAMGYTGPMTDVAERLRELNVEVLDKDLSGSWQMQAMQLQMQGMMFPPDASDEQLKDAVWVVLASPQDPRQMMMNPSAGQMGAKVQEHLKNGGSAMVLFDPQAEKMDFLREWGVEVKPDYLIVHEQVERQGARSEDMAMEYWRQQPVFIVNQYGDHLVTRPLRSLDSLMVPLVPVNTVDAKGVKTTRILPVPSEPKAWAEMDFDALRQQKTVAFNPAKDQLTPGDLPAPLWGGVIAEKEDGKGRLVVIGCRRFAFNDYLNEPDYEVARAQRRFVPRFPGNEELFVNSMYWLLKMDTMISISPASFEVARVKPEMKESTKNLWHFVVVALLPATVLGAGVMVYVKRRD